MKYVISKVLGFTVTLLLIGVITFLSFHILPSDPATLILGTEGDPARLESLREELGLNDPLIVRLVRWIGGVFQGDLGRSIRYGVDVAGLIKEALPVTLLLAFAGVVLALLISIPLGVLSAVKQGSSIEVVILILTQLGMALPAFWVGLLLINVFALRFEILPPAGFESAASLVLPTLALAIPRAAVLTRVVRSSVLETLNQDYLRTAKSKGLSRRTILYKHSLKNAAISILSVVGVHLTQLLGGTIIIEQVFSLPGLGQLLLAAVMQRDLPLVQGLVLTATGLILLVNLTFDLILVLFDPRLRFE